MKRVSYSVETKYKAVEMKIAGFSTKEIMKELNIKNRTQVETWWRWYRNEESYRFSQHVGKQYTYGKGLEELSEIERLKLENKRKDIELDIFKKVQGIGKEVVPAVVIDLVDQLKVKYSIKLILEVLNIPKSTYYRWKNKTYKNDTVTQKVIELCEANNYTYGYRKITALINQCYTSPINHKRVQRIMQEHQLNCRVRPKKTTRIGKPYYKTDNLLQRQFKASCPMEVLTTDITYLPFGHSMLYLSSIMDIYNGEIVAYKIDDKQDQSLVNDTLNQIDIPEGCILHSDQGSVYTSYAYYKLCEEKGIIRSMSRKGTPADNAPIESFHSSLKSETFYINNELNSPNHIVIDIVEKYIKNYNNNRIQQKLGYLSPVKYRELAA
ncbi:IS3 family transposase [Staphylococcus hominis]|uniref:IS3 family transposase n=1 Tax=Staphylococcus hominis TaxID=1290 RepID=UPI00115E4299|nr:IS3 family transposase [Staphylococcus hominis]MCI2861497.1 IS3 family transposase [Staphylococcus hominis]MCI2865964.1 IS3 family transposase [Staphylococcus hominis]MCI2877438.1 IS3 family transposase [Staphylococcus hominis]MCI2883321.1 IS3 family transposase [Staphylococcus hominis]MCI2915865.1 IS3 family transposase [Staphylococcus hominis]